MSEKKLLVADDSLTIQKVIRLALSNEGYDIQTVSDGNDALQQISLFQPDVILIDVSLPGKSAFEVKRAVNENNSLKKVHFILMSSAFEQVDEGQVNEVGFEGRLVKPFDPAHLRKILAEAGGGEVQTPSSFELDDEEEYLPPKATAQDFSKEITPPKKETYTPPSPPPPPPANLEAISNLSETLVPEGKPNEPFHGVEIAPPPPAPSIDLTDDSDSSSEGLSDDLWKEESSLENGEEDIKKLTESTIKMSGLDNDNWSVDEQNSIEPPASLSDPESSLALEVGDQTYAGFQINEPAMEPPMNLSDAGESFELDHSGVYSSDSGIDVDQPQPAPPRAPTLDVGLSESPSLDLENEPADSESSKTFPDKFGDSAGITAGPQVQPMTQGQMEELLSAQLKDTLEKLARKLLPDIAEKVVKDEIHKLLSNPP